MNEAKLSKEQAIKVVDEIMGKAHADLTGAKTQADTDESNAIAGLTDYMNSDEQGFITPKGYVGDLESEGAKAFADPKARKAQYDALAKLKDMTSTAVTPEEKFMMAQARMAEERDQRAAREAAIRNLAARGVTSGAAEMGSLLGGQAITSQNRLISDLGALANASKRSQWATEAFGNQANDIASQTFDERFKTGSATDAVNEFNNRLRTDYNIETDKFKADQQTQAWNKHKDVTDATTNAVNDTFGRTNTIAGKDIAGAGLKVGALTGGSDDVTNALKIALGEEEARRAEKLLNKKPDQGLLPDSIPLVGKWF
jgi:hypothetical protein